MAELKGSKTEKNLLEAFAGESMARNKYTYYASKAKKDGYKTVYIATDHIGLYEKYGFSYSESRTDIYNEESRIYFKEIN